MSDDTIDGTSDTPSSSSNDVEPLATEVLSFALAPRPERIEDALLAHAGGDFGSEVRKTRALLSSLASCLAPAPPSRELRTRLLGSVTLRMPRRALVVLDMIHDHLDPGTLLEVPRARAIVPALEQRIAHARAAGMPIVYVVDEHGSDDPDLDAWGTHAVRGTKGTEVLAELAPTATDWIVKKPSYSAFFGSDLSGVLDRLGVSTLVLTGCLTEIGVLATATDAMQRGFAVEVPRDCQAGSSMEAETAAVETIRVMAPFGPARRERLERIAKLAA
jgi:nicotinamidase/pyrazinamidase